MTTINQAIQGYLDSVSQARSPRTHRTYGNSMHAFRECLAAHKFDLERPVDELPEEAVFWLLDRVRQHAVSTERVYTGAVMGFYEYLVAENLAQPNLVRMRMLLHKRMRRQGARLPQFSRKSIDRIIQRMSKLSSLPAKDERHTLINLRDRAFLITLADTGLRVHEACKLTRGDIDWEEGRAQVIGKGDTQAMVRFSRRAQAAIRDYLSCRAKYDGNTGRPLATLPLFARHAPRAGSRTRPMTTKTGWDIVNHRVAEILGPEAVGTITPHSFRHYFVTTVLLVSGNLKLAQELARHKSITVTQRYAHISDDELDQGYWEIFENRDEEKE